MSEDLLKKVANARLNYSKIEEFHELVEEYNKMGYNHLARAYVRRELKDYFEKILDFRKTMLVAMNTNEKELNGLLRKLK